MKRFNQVIEFALIDLLQLIKSNRGRNGEGNCELKPMNSCNWLKWSSPTCQEWNVVGAGLGGINKADWKNTAKPGIRINNNEY